MTNNLYGVESTDSITLDGVGLPVGVYKAMIITEEEDPKGNGLVAKYEILDGVHKGKTGKVWYNTLHSNTQTANIARQALKRIADSTGCAVSPSAPLKGRVLTLDVQKQKKNDQYTEIKRYLPSDYTPEIVAPF